MSQTSMDPELAAAVADESREARVNALRASSVSTPPSFALEHLYGPVGDYVRLMAPHTEASPVSIYATALTLCGAIIGRGPTMLVGNTPHHARLFTLLVGPTGSGRKGTGLSVGGTQLAKLLDSDFADARIASGLSSAEGLIAEVRDATPALKDDESGKILRLGDPGVDDKRLLVKEGELGSALEAMRREGNRLSPILRDAWDGVDLRSMVKRDPQRATAPHIAIVGAITKSELGKLLDQGAVLNGLANRFLPIWTSRVHLCPLPSEPDPLELATIVQSINRGITASRMIGRVRLSKSAEVRWTAEYPRLAVIDDASPNVRALTERGAPYVLRLGMLFALLDGLGAIEEVHLEAALAVWQYAADTWRYLYADGALRSPLADKLLSALESAGPTGLSRTSIREDVVRSGDISAQQIASALAELAGAGLAHVDKIATAGRAVERWRHTRHVRHEPLGAAGAKGGKVENIVPSPSSTPIAPFAPFASPRVRAQLTNGEVIELAADSPDLLAFENMIVYTESVPPDERPSDVGAAPLLATDSGPPPLEAGWWDAINDQAA